MRENLITAWSARLIADGTEVRSTDVPSIEHVHARGGCDRLAVIIDGQPPINVSCAAAAGEKLRLFTRRGILDANTPNARQVNMPVIEVVRSDGTYTRLYVHPEHGLVLATLDLNL